MADLDRSDTDRNPPPTTTISTIAVQSGNTKIVIALLQSREWLELKVVELTPSLTLLGSTLQEASELQKAHDEVLLKIQSKQSPVEELLSQADQLIANQKDKGHVYVAMADSLAAAWKDINNLLQKRKEILNLNVRYHSNAAMCLERTRALELACRGAPLPVEVPAIKELLARLTEVKRAMLESLMTTLQDGRALVDTLREIALEGTLDSRPSQIKTVTECAISQVEHWMEELHDRRRLLELSWQERKTQLEQCLALALLTADLKILEEIIADRSESLSRSKDQLGDSEASAQLLLHEHKKLLPEAKDFQEQALKILRATEHFAATGHFAGDEATAQAYHLLNSTSEYLEGIENRSNILEMSILFFKSAQTALTKLDQIEVQLSVSNLPSSCTQLISLHSSLSKSIEEVTEVPIKEGYKLLTSVPGAEGVKRILDDIENRKLNLSLKCTAHKEENIRLIQSMNNFNEVHKQLCLWLENTADTFLQGHRDMGSVLAMAKDFLQIHLQFHSDLQIKGTEINSLISVLLPVINMFDGSARTDIENKIETLRSHWKRIKQYTDKRTELATAYVKFHTLAVDLANVFDSLEAEMSKVNPDETLVRQLEEQWHEAQQVFIQLSNVGNNFREDIKNVGEPYLDAERARLCVDTLLQHFGDRKFSIESCWKAWENNLAQQKAFRAQWEVNMTETTRTVDWITKLDAELYPVLHEDEHVLGVILHDVEKKVSSVLPEIKRAQTEIHSRITTAESLITQGEVAAHEEILIQLRNLEQHVQSIGTNYQILLEMLVAFLKNMIQLEKTIDSLKKQYGKLEFPSTVADVEQSLREHDASRQAIQELFKFTHVESQQIIEKVKQQEPESAMEKDVCVLRGLLEDKRCDWERAWSDHKLNLEQHLQLCHFDADLAQIHNNFDELDKQLASVKGQYGESLGAAKSTSIAFTYFEKTIEILRQRIETFVNAGEVMLKSKHTSSSHIEEGLHSIQKRWDAFSSHVSHTRNLIDISIQYFTLIEEAEEWFKECSRLLVGIARRSSSVRKPEEATHLLEELEIFFKSGEVKQDERITKISELATQLFGDSGSSELHQVKSERKEMLDSFFQVSRELRTLVDTLNKPSEPIKMEIEDIKPTAEMLHTVSTTETISSSVQEKIIIMNEESVRTSSLHEERVHKSPSPPPKKAKFQNENEEHQAPLFIAPLADAIIEEGNKLIFECKVTGVPTPQISWMKDGIPIDNNLDYHTQFNDGICSLTIEETFAEDSAKFICRASNEAGVSETTATLSVRECEGETPPSFVIPLLESKVKEGSQFEFICKVAGNPLPTVQWCKDTICIDHSPDYVITYNNGDAVLKFDEITLHDQAEYSCKATNRLGIESTSAVLIVEGKERIEVPVFTVPLSNIMARAGQKIKLECEVHGTPEPQITWLHNGKSIKETRDLKINYDQHNAVLVITEAFPKDAGTYEVKAVNCAGESISACHVSVKGRLPTETSDSELASDMEPCKPVIQVSLKDLAVFEGMKARLDCIIVGQPEPEVIWYHENRPVKESGDFQLLFHGDRCSLIIKEAFVEDAGEYKAVAINSAGEASSSCRLTVQTVGNTSESSTQKSAEESHKPGIELTAPHFTTLLTDVLITEGDSVHLKCIVKGEPIPSINWYLNNIDISNSDRIQCKQESDGTCSLTINNVLPSDKGIYTVKAINSLGEAKCFSQLIVKPLINTDNASVNDVNAIEQKPVSPIFTELFADRTVIEGATTKFECVVTAKPTPKIHWLFNENPVSGKDFLVSTSGPRQVLTIPNVTKNLAGKISCVAENEAGKATCLATLSVRDVPVDSLLPSLDSLDLSETSSFEIKRSVFMKSVTQSQVVTDGSGKEPTKQIHGLSSCTEQTMQKIGDNPSVQVQTHKTSEYHNVGGVEEKLDQQFQSSNNPNSVVKLPTKEISRRKEVVPRFVTPITGKIVNQHEDVILEATIESYPTAEVKWTRNGQLVLLTDSITQSWELNRARLEIKNIRLEDAGKYTCTASNTAGTASSTADIVVKKTVFPPVIGKRLQSSTHEVGQRVVLEVEITGIPEPTVTWYKDEQQIASTSLEYRILNQGTSYSLIINKVGHAHSGKYCVKATNWGGEALSIADLVIVEPQQITLKYLETMEQTVAPQPLVKSTTLLTTDADDFSLSSDKTVVSSNTTKTDKIVSVHLEQSSHMYQQTSDISVTYPQQHMEISIPLPAVLESYIEPVTNKQESYIETIDKKESYIEPAKKELHIETAEKKETVTNIDTHIKSVVVTDSFVPQFISKDTLEETEDHKESNIEDSSITKKSALEFFKNIIKENDEEKHTSKQFEKSTSKKTFDTQTHLTSLPSVNAISNSAYQPEYKYQESEDIFYKQQTDSESSIEKTAFDLQPEPPPEIGYIPKTSSKPKEDLSERVKKLEDSHRTLSAVEIPSGAVKIFPTPLKKDSESAAIYKEVFITNNSASGIREIRDTTLSNESSKDDFTFSSQKLGAADIPKEPELVFPKTNVSALKYGQSTVEDITNNIQFTSHETYKSTMFSDVSDTTCEKTIPIFSKSDISCDTSHKTPLPPSAEGVAMEKLWSRTLEHPRSHSVNLPVARSTSPMPSAEGVAMDKLWGHKQSNIKRVWPPPKPAEDKNTAPWVVKPTTEISWPPSQMQQISIPQEHVTKSTENTVLASNKSFEYFNKEIKTSEVKKVLPPAENITLIQDKPVSKEEFKLEDLNLEPGPPPEIGYAKPPLERRQSLIETIEQDLEKDLDKPPSRHLVGAVRIIPPPPAKKEKSTDQVVPQKCSESKFTETHSFKESKMKSMQSFQSYSNLQSENICKSKSTLPPRPTKFIKGSFTESDHESDYDSSKITSKWASTYTSRPHSVVGHDAKIAEPQAPSAVTLRPVSCSIPLTKESVQRKTNIKTEEYFSQISKHSQTTAAAMVLKPGSPPEFIQPIPLTTNNEGTEKVKPGSPKSKSKISCDMPPDSGYMADTDEPQTLCKILKEDKILTKSEESRTATTQQVHIKSEKKNITGKAQSYHPVSQSSFKKETTTQQKITKDYDETEMKPFSFKSEGSTQSKRIVGPPPPSPSKFIKGEFRESDYESDYESRIPPIWRPYESDTELTFKPVRPILTPVSGRTQNIGHTPTPPTEFDEPPQFSGPPRPKFEPIEKPFSTVKKDVQSQKSLKVIRPKPLPAQTSPIETIIATPAIKHDSEIILKPGSPPKIDFAPPPLTTSYRVPGGTQLETSNTMSFAESSGSSKRIVSMQQTTRVIRFGEESDKKVVKQTERQKRENAPTPTKFVAGKPRESDYESDFEGTKIKPVWVPESSMKRSLHVEAEQKRLQRVEEMRKRFGETTTETKGSSVESNDQCRFGTSSAETSQVDNYAASKHFSEMTHSFKSKAQQFATDLMTDVKSNKDKVDSKIMQKQGMLNGNDPQTYREESKVSEYGTKHIDPDTGLIYFKYDFGYEFGVILPGEGKCIQKKSQILDKKEEGNIDFPVIHEKTIPKKSSHEMKTVKWEQTSESEMSDIEGESRRKRQIQREPHVFVQLGTPSPQSLSPSIQSLSPYSAGCDSTVSPHISWKDVSSPLPVSQTPLTAAGFDSVLKPPLFITPLRDIACVVGQPARFECIVQAEPVPDVMWSKDEQMLHPSPQYTTEYRNGVCRLSLHQAMPYDAGKYTCTARNIMGMAVTESTLQVAGERRSVCK